MTISRFRCDGWRRMMLRWCLLLIFSGTCLAAPMWDMAELGKTPAVFPADEHSKEGVKSVFYEGEPFQGKPTRVFAYYGIPEAEVGAKVPAMVLVHGGGGSAFDWWVKLWNSRGYAAIAMDTCGGISRGGANNHERHEFSGPEGWGGFDQMDRETKDQWTYHAVAAVIRGHSLLRSFPEVDVERVGLTGISWGGYLTSIVSGVDSRFKFAVPVYGCGYIHENSTWLENFKTMGEDNAERWTRHWEPSVYLPSAKMPMLWVTGTNDFAYPLDSLQKSYKSTAGSFRLSIPGDMKHGHEPGADPKVIHAFADQMLKGGTPIPEITGSELNGGILEVTYTSDLPVESAELLFTKDDGVWKERKWTSIPARLEGSGKASATVPDGAKVVFLNLKDPRGFVISCPHAERD